MPAWGKMVAAALHGGVAAEWRWERWRSGAAGTGAGERAPMQRGAGAGERLVNAHGARTRLVRAPMAQTQATWRPEARPCCYFYNFSRLRTIFAIEAVTNVKLERKKKLPDQG